MKQHVYSYEFTRPNNKLWNDGIIITVALELRCTNNKHVVRAVFEIVYTRPGCRATSFEMTE